MFEKLKEKGFIKYITLICGTLLLAETIRNVCHGVEEEFQIFKEYYFYRGCIFFLLVILLLRRIKIKNPIYIAAIVGYTGYSVKYLIEQSVNYGEHLVKLNNVKYAAMGLFWLVILDVIVSKNLTTLSKMNRVYVVLAIVAVVMSHALNYYYAHFVLVPSLALFLTPLTKEQWNYFTDCLAMGFYLAFVWIMAKSLIAVPFTGARYYGTFLNLYTASSFAGGAFIACMYFYIKFKKDNYNKLFPAAALIAMIFPLFSISIIGARSAQLAVIVSLLIAFIMLADNISVVKKRARTALVIFGVFLVVGTIVLIILSKIDPKIAGKIPNKFLANKLSYWIGRGKTLMKADSVTGYFPEGSLMNALDRFASTRFTIIAESLRTTKLLGSYDLTVVTPYIAVVYPHNTYLTWLRAYGWLGGIPVIAWFFGGLVTTIKNTVKGKMEYILPALLFVYCASSFISDTLMWECPIIFMLLLLQYPILINFKENEKCDVEAKETNADNHNEISKKNLAN